MAVKFLRAEEAAVITAQAAAGLFRGTRTLAVEFHRLEASLIYTFAVTQREEQCEKRD
ncbi:hypothetical protein FB563_2687 [Streptomyces puniciscabiei]|uniref:Uncharacterized protein n=1 Tax=Streptomyces puniciscabiei TaxID=164348 RepID=A0A542UF39_9ACTN|nr:hypothetical protein [Streptomyces puniciscabiei]TQK97704.1 hypothetical protein FB563_2687 [Streptomyces puniciscabiei]